MRKSTPDLLGEIMGVSGNGTHKAIKQEDNKAINTASSTAAFLVNQEEIKPANLKAIKQESNKTNYEEEEPKEKATFNLSLAILEELEDTWIKLKRAGKEKRVTKTLIVETALKMAIQDYEKRGGGSDLFRSL